MNFPAAFLIGLSMASIPGPVSVLIATQTLRHGARAALLTMTAPLVLDMLAMLPLGIFLQASMFSGSGAVALGMGGAAFLIWLGAQSIRAGIRHVRSIRATGAAPARGKKDLPPFLKGFVTHVASPYPYIFWATVGGSFVRQGFDSGGVAAAAIFPAGFWTGTTTFTLLLIYLVARGKKLLPAGAEPYLHHASGALLIAGGIYLGVGVWQGFF